MKQAQNFRYEADHTSEQWSTINQPVALTLNSAEDYSSVEAGEHHNNIKRIDSCYAFGVFCWVV